MPKRGEKDQAGNAWFNFLDRLNLGKIGIRFLAPEEIYADYLQNKTKDLTDLDKTENKFKFITSKYEEEIEQGDLMVAEQDKEI